MKNTIFEGVATALVTPMNEDGSINYDRLKTLIDEGYEKQILLCNDICLKTMWKKFGGTGYAHILRTVKAMAIENGISENTYMGMLTDNVRNFLS